MNLIGSQNRVAVGIVCQRATRLLLNCGGKIGCPAVQRRHARFRPAGMLMPRERDDSFGQKIWRMVTGEWLLGKIV